MNVNNQVKPLHSQALETLKKLRDHDIGIAKSGGTQKNGQPKTNRSERSLSERIARHFEGAKAKSSLPPINQLADKFAKGMSTGKMTPSKAVSLLSQMREHALKSNAENPQAVIYKALKEQVATMSPARRESFGNMLSPDVVSLITDHLDKSVGKNQDLQNALHLINPGISSEPSPEPELNRGDSKAQQLKDILIGMQKAVSPGSYADARGREMSPTQIREIEIHLTSQISKLDDAPKGASATEVRSSEDKFRTKVMDDVRVGAFDKFNDEGASNLTLEQSVGVLKSAYENQQVIPVEKFKILMSSDSVGKAVGTLTGNNVPRKPKVGDDTPDVLLEGARGLKQLIDNTLTPSEKRDLKSRIDFLCSYAPIAKSKFGLAEKGENDEAMQNKQWIKSVTVSFGLFVGIPQEQIAFGSNIRSDGILARDLITSLAVHKDIIFAELQTQDDKFWSDLGKLINSKADSEQIASFCETHDRPVPSLAEIQQRLAPQGIKAQDNELDLDEVEMDVILKDNESISEGVSNDVTSQISPQSAKDNFDLSLVSIEPLETILKERNVSFSEGSPQSIREEIGKLTLTTEEKALILQDRGMEIGFTTDVNAIFSDQFGLKLN